jgi:hypothetical protein
MALIGMPAAAGAQELAAPAAGAPRVEIGAGGGLFYSGGTMPVTDGMVEVRAGVRVSRSWSLEGLVDVQPPGNSSLYGYYRIQAAWRPPRPGVRPFVAVGGAGEMNWYRWPYYEVTDHDGHVLWALQPGSRFSVGAPYYPTASVGVEKILASRVALRAELTTAFAINDYGISVAFFPAVSLSVPIGRYRTSR